MEFGYSAATNGLYRKDLHAEFPADAVELTESEYNGFRGRELVANANGKPMLAPARAITVAVLLERVDAAADAARRKVAGDPLRAEEYKAAAAEAKTFAQGDYQGAVPPMVAAWAINGRTAQQAADNILAEAAQYNAALVQLRTVRLAAKEHIRTLMAANQVGQAQQLAEQTIAAIEAAVAGIGNNA